MLFVLWHHTLILRPQYIESDHLGVFFSCTGKWAHDLDINHQHFIDKVLKPLIYQIIKQFRLLVTFVPCGEITSGILILVSYTYVLVLLLICYSIFKFIKCFLTNIFCYSAFKMRLSDLHLHWRIFTHKLTSQQHDISLLILIYYFDVRFKPLCYFKGRPADKLCFSGFFSLCSLFVIMCYYWKLKYVELTHKW